MSNCQIDTRIIPLTQGQEATVSAEDYEFLNKWKWIAIWQPHVNNFYAVRGQVLRSRAEARATGLPRMKQVRMHRVIMGDPDSFVDHKNGKTLDNTRGNLRIATPAQNSMNSKKQRRVTSSKYKGVTFRKRSGKWEAQIRHGEINVKNTIGQFDTEEEAHAAYCKAAVDLYGEFANFG